MRTVGSGGCGANSSALGHAISTGLDNGVPYGKFVKPFAKVNCITSIKNPTSEGHSCVELSENASNSRQKTRAFRPSMTGALERPE
ncbi:TSCPD domain-containing protein [Methanosphaerula palustris]